MKVASNQWMAFHYAIKALEDISEDCPVAAADNLRIALNWAELWQRERDTAADAARSEGGAA